MEAALISFETREEWDSINQYLFQRNIYDEYYTSGTDLAIKGEHVWFSTGEPLELNIWGRGEPSNNGGIEHCDVLGYLGTSTNYDVLNDIPCDLKRYYICEAPQPKTASFFIW
ncbi:C-type lectin 37Da-like [Drosophila obscura]|uniref:C-type lectin 37Da-like n=1 Tax=Drosophila obscura TaxID=7282 RepID=UPI001BB2B2E7|nr:C-type lectin 37Da-like [Drosophila obscura]